MTTLGFFIFDPMYLIMVFLPGLLVGMWAQSKVKKAYGQASKIRSSSGLSGAQAAREIMQAAGIDDVEIQQTQGRLSDHYDPRKRVLRLSPEVHGGNSLASLGIAAHEAGHALQHAKGYTPLVLRNAIVPMASIGTNLGIWLVIGGLILNALLSGPAQPGEGGFSFGFGLAVAGLLLFGSTVVFQIINLPVEFDASKRAREQLLGMGMVTATEDGTVGKVLNAAALTYVAALLTAILNFLYLLMLVLGSRR
ncbi:MAG: hypothetical protein GVY28_07095 [Alphaproteobacteria bacterium]|jgi:Zn-dependent membrane protease YugP|nr:hypothetical protein [Alphaproteobacteria bacterium]